MKFFACVLFLCLLTFVLLLHGPAVDQQHRYKYTESKNSITENTYCDESAKTYEDTSTEISKSYCVDRNLHWPDGDENIFEEDVSSINRGNEYYDHCCYVRFQSGGTVYHGCKGLKELDYLDIKETAYKYEQEHNVKVFHIDCNSSYTYLSVAVIISLLGLLL